MARLLSIVIFTVVVLQSPSLGVGYLQEAGQERAATPSQPDIGATLWQMRRAASEGRWAECIEWADLVLGLPQASSPLVAGDTMLYRYAALRHLDKFAEAEVVHAAFDALAAKHPADLSKLALQLHMLRASLGDDVDVPEAAAMHAPPPDDLWTLGSPDEMGMDAALLDEHLKQCQRSGADAVLVARNGVIVSEWYSPLYREPVYTMSSVKSITGLLAGLLVADGKLALNDPVGKYIPEWSDGMAARATVRDILTMTAGLPRKWEGFSSAEDGDSVKYVSGLEPLHEPGTRWIYSNAGAQLLSPVLERAAEQPLGVFAHERLFVPMGLRETALRKDPAGNALTYADAETTLRELAAFGQLALNQGEWHGEQLLSQAWMREMTTPAPARVSVSDDAPLPNPNYGYLWWAYSDPDVVSMQGYLSTSVWAFPEHGVVVARVQSRPYLHAVEQYDQRAMFKLIDRAVVEP